MLVMAAKSEVGKWLDKQYLLWQMKAGEKRTWGEFAEWVSVGRGTLDKWSRGDRSPEAESVELLAVKCNDDSIYDIVGIPKPDARYRMLKRIFDEQSENGKNEMIKQAGKWVKRGGGERATS